MLIENFRPDVMARLGLGYDVLKQINPRLVMLSISGFGHNGPESRRAAYAPIVHAESGLIARQKKITGAHATDIGVSIADTNAALHGLVGLLSALLMRQRTGVGQHVDIAMIDSMLVTDDHLHYTVDGRRTPQTDAERGVGYRGGHAADRERFPPRVEAADDARRRRGSDAGGRERSTTRSRCVAQPRARSSRICRTAPR